MARSGASTKLHRRQNPAGRDIEAWQSIFATAADQRRQRQSATLEGNKRRSMGDRPASAAAEYGRSGSAGEQDGTHRLGGDAPAGELPAHGLGSLNCRAVY